MPSQEPPLNEKSEEVDLPPEDTEDADGSKLLTSQESSSVFNMSDVISLENTF